MHLIRRDDNSSYNSNTHYRRIIRLNLIAETNLIRVSNLTELYVALASNKIETIKLVWVKFVYCAMFSAGLRMFRRRNKEVRRTDGQADARRTAETEVFA